MIRTTTEVGLIKERFYPFTAIVGQEKMVFALILNAIEPRIGGVLIHGERGTGKSTAVRGLAALLPRIRSVKGCRFNCDPEKPANWCNECKSRYSPTQKPEWIEQATNFINLPVSVTEDRVVGTLDIENAIQKGERFFDPGILASANRGLLYIDEVNLLDDHVVDVLLDSAAMGVNIVEREGISFSHPSRFILVGTMNPEEGTLRPQLLDRFGLSVSITSVRDERRRMLIMQRVLDYENDPYRFHQTWRQSEKSLSERICNAQRLLPSVRHKSQDLEKIAELTTYFGVDGHRPDLVILKTSRAHAAYMNRREIQREDIFTAAQLVIPHRLRRKPYEMNIEIPLEMQERVSHIVYPERKARLEDILNDTVDPATITDLHNECGYYFGG